MKKFISILVQSRFKVLLALMAAFFAIDGISQVPFSPGAQITSYTANRVRGYHFTAQSAFRICEVYVPNSMNNNMWHVEIVKFNSSTAPPAFPATTNAFVSQFYADSVTGNNSITCNVVVASGDVIGIYGSRSTSVGTTMANSYDSPNFVTSILGNNTTLRRSGMQFPLNNQQMHNIWSEVSSNTSRIIGYHSCCPLPPKPQGPFNGPTQICQGDTVTWWIPLDSIAEDYSWTVPVGDSIVANQGDTMITVAIGPNSTGGQICVELEDSCTWSGDTCFTYTINQPTTPSSITGLTSVCQNNSEWYSVVAANGILEYDWSITNATLLSNEDSNAINVSFSVGNAEICVRVKDSCAWSDSTCITVNTMTLPNLANAGPDRTVCSDHKAQLAANAANIGSGEWTVVSSPGPGTFSDSTAHNSTYLSSVPGTHILQWTVSAGGCPSTSDQMIVTINITPTAGFSTVNVCEGGPVPFNDQSTGNGATINSWLWDMDGDLVNNHVVQNPIHQYLNSGTYSVRLIANAQGCADTLFKDVYVNPVPDMDISADNVCFNEVMSFNNANSVATGAIATTTWDFGDGTPAVSATNVSHLYQDPGFYTVTCNTVSDSTCESSQQIDVRVYHLPKADFVVDNSCQYQTSVFSDKSTVTGADVDAWTWTFGDGGDSSIIQDPSHDYNINGFVPVHLQVWSSQGCFDDSIGYIEIYPTPVSEFNFTNKVCLGDTLDLDAVSHIAYGAMTQYDWQVDSTWFYNGKEVFHMFDAVGDYSVRLTTTSEKGCESSILKSVPVYEIPKADFYFTDGCEDNKVQFTDTTFFLEPVMKYEWDFGDSTVLADEHNPEHVFEDFGLYDVSLYVESFRGCTSLIEHPIKIYERLIPRFDATPDSGCSPLTVSFIDSTASESGVSWERSWVFGDGNTRLDTAENIYLNYSGKHLSYDVTLKVLTEENCYSEVTKDSIVYVVPQPAASFQHTPEDLLTLSTKRPVAQFINTSSQANRYVWSFGDEEKSSEHNPFHEWAEAGDYEVVMIARNIYGCTDTTKTDVNVHHVNVPYIPSAFTPNGDGKNEFFFVAGLEDITEMDMAIYDRWGTAIYETNGLDASWDGRNNQNKIIQQGLYFYKIRYTDKTGEVFEHFGSVSVLGIE